MRWHIEDIRVLKTGRTGYCGLTHGPNNFLPPMERIASSEHIDYVLEMFPHEDTLCESCNLLAMAGSDE
jgi:hypothetical protein